MPKHRQGGKFSGSHTTLIDLAVGVVDAAHKQEVVSKIVLGKIERVTSRKRRLKFIEIPAGWKVVVYGNTTIQTLYIYTVEQAQTRKVLERLYL